MPRDTPLRSVAFQQLDLLESLNMSATLQSRMTEVFKAMRERTGKTLPSDLANLVGCGKSVVSMWTNGGARSMSLLHALKIEKELGLSHLWVMTGDGPAYVNDRHSASPTPPEKPVSSELQLVYLSSDEVALVTAYREAEAIGRVAIRRTAEAMPRMTQPSPPKLSNGH